MKNLAIAIELLIEIQNSNKNQKAIEVLKSKCKDEGYDIWDSPYTDEINKLEKLVLKNNQINNNLKLARRLILKEYRSY